MREPSRKLRLSWFTLVMVLALLSAGAAGAAPPVKEIKAGTDCWQTQPGTEQSIARIPAGFFGRGSQAIAKAVIKFKGNPLTPAVVTGTYPPNCGCALDKVDTKITWLDRHGNAITDPNRMVHAVTQVVDQTTKVDTCVRRTTTAKITRQGPKGAVKVDLRLVKLSLQSESPLEVTFKEPRGTSTKKYDVYVTESARQPRPDSQMTLTPDHVDANRASGKVKLGSLHFTYDVEFRPVGGGPSVWMRGQNLKLANTPGTFEALFP
jgi:hypothetical protein